MIVHLNGLCICKVDGNGDTEILSQTLYCAIHVIAIACRVQNTVSVFAILIGQGVYVIYRVTSLQSSSTLFELVWKHAVDLAGDSLHRVDGNHAEQFRPHNVRVVLLLLLANPLCSSMRGSISVWNVFEFAFFIRNRCRHSALILERI